MELSWRKKKHVTGNDLPVSHHTGEAKQLLQHRCWSSFTWKGPLLKSHSLACLFRCLMATAECTFYTLTLNVVWVWAGIWWKEYKICWKGLCWRGWKLGKRRNSSAGGRWWVIAIASLVFLHIINCLYLNLLGFFLLMPFWFFPPSCWSEQLCRVFAAAWGQPTTLSLSSVSKAPCWMQWSCN